MTDQPEYNTDMPVGEILRQAREHYGQSLNDVEKNLRIRAVQLDAIERNEIERLPGRVYAIGFVRSYSEYLGFDPDKMVDLFKRQSGGTRNDPKLEFPVAAAESRLPGPVLIAVSVLLFVVVVTSYVMFTGTDRSVIDAIPSVEETEFARAQGRVISETPFGPEMPADVQRAEAEEERGIILNVVENSWVEIRDAAGRKLVSQVLRKGDQYFVPDRPDLTMSIGNAAGVEIRIGDLTVPPLGPRGEVRRNISLNFETLKSLATNGQ